MEIALFTDGVIAVVGKKSDEGKIDHQIVDTELLFQDPALIYDRLLAFLKRKFEINDPTEIKKIIFGIPGYINTINGQIEVSRNLDEVTLVKSYRGYSFKEAFGKLVGPENIYIINDAVAIGLGVESVREDFKPALIISINKGVGVSIVDAFGDLHATELGSWFILNHLKAVTFLISRDKIEDLLDSGSSDIYGDYTTIFIDVINQFRGQTSKVISIATKKATQWVLSIYNKLPQQNKQLKNLLLQIPSDKIFIWSAIEEYLDKQMLEKAGLKDILHFPTDENEKSIIPIFGCFEYLSYLKREKARIEYIEYWAMAKMQYQFRTYDEFYKHWKSVKSFANNENVYKIFYVNGVEKVLKMDELKYEYELEQYRY